MTTTHRRRNEMTIHAAPGSQWDIDTYAFTVSYQDVDVDFPTRPPESYTEITSTNRPVSEPHANRCRDFILNTPGSPLGTITIASDPDTLVYEDGCLVIELNNVVIIDGQHRRLAIHNAIVQAESDGRRELAQEIRERQINVLAFATSKDAQIQQLFRWQNLNRPIDRATSSLFNHENPFDDAAAQLIEASHTLRGNVGRISGGTKVGTPYLITADENNDILKSVQFERRQTFNSKKILAEWSPPEKRQAMVAAGVSFWDNFMPQAVPDIRLLREGDLRRESLSTQRAINAALDPGFIKCLAVIFRQWTMYEGNDQQPLAEYIAGIDTSRAGLEQGAGFGEFGLYNGETRKFVNKRSAEMETAVARVIRAVKDVSAPAG